MIGVPVKLPGFIRRTAWAQVPSAARSTLQKRFFVGWTPESTLSHHSSIGKASNQATCRRAPLLIDISLSISTSISRRPSVTPSPIR